EQDLQFQNHILPLVSRTFALTIPQLPAGLDNVVSNAYLLCRIADTIEDDPVLDAQTKSNFLAGFLSVIAANEDSKDFSTQLASRLSKHTRHTDRELVKNTTTVVRNLARFTSTQRNAVIRCVTTMCKSMPEFQDGKTLEGLPELTDLDRYCYFVAGIVGEMLTDLFCEHCPELEKQRDEMMALSVSFGQGLQMTNILKDIWEDRDANTCWLPSNLFHDLEGGLSRAMRDRNSTAMSAGVEKLVGIAHAHLRAALLYTQLIPRQEVGIRRFCLWAIGMAMLTLRRIHKNPGYNNGGAVKISRRAVRATVITCNIAQYSNYTVSLLFALVSRGMPLANDGEYCPPSGTRLASDRQV
ncbi:MAG: phytoene/squalene synthase family protein, partial [Gammaproteobacteria bacterium]|nr:phytoene/squalene synthase family protein [Gammaproteobacteria bacterium]